MDWPLPPESEVVVIGGGPAGALAARQAAEAGLATLLVEAKEHVGEGCHCAEWTPLLLTREVEIPAAVRCSRTEGLQVRLAGRSVVAQAAGLVLERKLWEKGLLLAAARAGALVLAGTKFMGFDGGGLILAGPFGQQRIKTQAVVGADGGLSRVAASLGLKRLEGVSALQLEVDLAAELEGGLVSFRPDLLGYLWLFPKGRSANLGLGGQPLGGTGLGEMLGQWWGSLVEEGLVGRSVFRRAGGFIPSVGLREEIVFRRGGQAVILSGDAAGLTHPLTGAGIPQAVISGRLAGQAASGHLAGDRDALNGYQAEVREIWGGYLARGLKRRARAGEIWPQDYPGAVREYWPLWPRRGRREEANGRAA